MAATALNFLTAALAPTGPTTADATASGTAGQTDGVAGLFQSVLASAVTRATAATAAQVPADAGATSSPETGKTDLLAKLLGLLENATEADLKDAEKKSAVNSELLSQLLAALGVNAPQLAAVAATPTPADTQLPTAAVQTTTVTAQLATLTVTSQTAAPVLTANPTRTGTSTTPVSVSPLSLPTNATVAPTTVPQPADQIESATVVAPQIATVADANRVAGRAPVVVLQTPIAVGPGFQLPPAVVPVGADVQPPVNEPTAVKGLPPVAPGVRETPTGNLPADPVPTEVAAGVVTRPVPVPFAVPVEAASKPSAGHAPPGVSAVPNPTSGATPPAAVSTPTSATLQPTNATPQQVAPAPQRPDLAGRVPAVTAPVRPAAPDIAITAAQPVDLSAGRIDFGRIAELSGFPTPLVPADDASAADRGTVVAVGAAPFALAPGRTAAPTETPAVASTPPLPVADQLCGPISAHLRVRPTGETELQIRLDPPELGTVKLKIVSTGGDVRAELHVSSEAVRRVVESQLPELRQKLDDAGVKVERFVVTADPNGGTARDDRSDRRREPVPADPPVPAVRARRTGATPSATGRIDVSV